MARELEEQYDRKGKRRDKRNHQCLERQVAKGQLGKVGQPQEGSKCRAHLQRKGSTLKISKRDVHDLRWCRRDVIEPAKVAIGTEEEDPDGECSGEDEKREKRSEGGRDRGFLRRKSDGTEDEEKNREQREQDRREDALEGCFDVHSQVCLGRMVG